VFILYAVVIGLALGLLLGRRLAGLSMLRFRLGWVMVAGLLVQVVLFSEPVTARIGELGPPIYVGSTLAVLAAVLVNVRIPGVAIVALGATSNLLAIVSNGGYMPASPGAMAALGKTAPTEYSNSTVLAQPAFEPLTDIFALPSWLPFSNLFSIGDVLITLGVVIIIVVAMGRRVASLPAAEPA
jgi:hypothetical protein